MLNQEFTIKNAYKSEFEEIGELLVSVYSKLPDFPSPELQPNYYHFLRNIGTITEKPMAQLLIATNIKSEICGAVVYFGDLQFYGSGGTIANEKGCGFRLLAVNPKHQGNGIGKLLTNYCIELGKKENHTQLLIHSTKSMKVAWKMYEKLGFERYHSIDFMQDSLQVFGFRLNLKSL